MEALLLLVLVYFVMFYFLKLRPEKQKKKQHEDMKRTLAAGDQITMIDGVVGTVCAVKEQTIVVETGADRVRIEYAKWGILERGIATVTAAEKA